MPAPYPALRWHGSKWRLARWVQSHFSDHFTYVEPFGGSAAILLRKEPSPAEVYNDRNSALVNFFTVLREQPEALLRAIHYTPISREEYQHCWSTLQDGTAVERARKLVVATYQARGGIVDRSSAAGWRIFAKRSAFSQTPADQWQTIGSRLEWVADRLRGVFIEHADATEVISRNDSADTLIYADPPYVPETRKDDQQNYAHDMTLEEHGALLDVLMSCKGKVILSGYDNRLYNDRLRDWTMLSTKARVEQNIEATECLWLNPAAAAASPVLASVRSTGYEQRTMFDA